VGKRRPVPPPNIDSVILIPLADRVRMPPRKAFQAVHSAGLSPNVKYFLDSKKTKNSMMSISTIFREKPKKQESITNRNSVLCQMSLRGASLAKRAPTRIKHWVLVAQTVRAQASLGDLRNNIA